MEENLKKMAVIIAKQQKEIYEINEKLDYLLKNIEINFNNIESTYQFV